MAKYIVIFLKKLVLKCIDTSRKIVMYVHNIIYRMFRRIIINAERRRLMKAIQFSTATPYVSEELHRKIEKAPRFTFEELEELCKDGDRV